MPSSDRREIATGETWRTTTAVKKTAGESNLDDESLSLTTNGLETWSF